MAETYVVLCVPAPPPPGSSFGKGRLAASDQPRDCPLCGLVIRQARNLRRHIETACKYRMQQESQVIELDPGDILSDDFDKCDTKPPLINTSDCNNLEGIPSAFSTLSAVNHAAPLQTSNIENSFNISPPVIGLPMTASTSASS